MVGPPPLQPGCYYHIYSRGNNKENIFIEERNYEYFINLYVHHIVPVADTYAYCLLRNHFHFLVRVKDEAEAQKDSNTFEVLPDASQSFGNLFNAYAKAINRIYHRSGSLFEHPFGREVVTTDSYLTRLVFYIHWNPQKHGFVEDFKRWSNSSYRAILSTGATFIEREEVLRWFRDRRGFTDFHENQAAENILSGFRLVDDDTFII
jgi:REP element-mobilizing transposase RayT